MYDGSHMWMNIEAEIGFTHELIYALHDAYSGMESKEYIKKHGLLV